MLCAMTDFTKLAFEHAPIGLVLSENRIIKRCNTTFSHMLGYCTGEVEGRSFRMFYGSDEEFDHVGNVGISALRRTGKYSDERLLRHREGYSIWCRFRAHSMTPDKPLTRLILSYALIYENKLPITLSKRERQVIGFMNQGLTSKEIARELGLSHRTIEDVRARLLKRFGVKRSADLLGRLTEFG